MQSFLKKCCLFFFYWLFCIVAMAQKKVIHQSLIWYGWYENIELKKDLSFTIELENRQFIDPSFAQHQTLIRGHFHRFFDDKKWDVSAGMCLFVHSPNDPKATNRLKVPELRPHIETIYRHQIKQLLIEQRLRTEVRFFHNTTDTRTDLEEGYQFNNFRFRYRCQFIFPLFKFNHHVNVKSKLNNEIHIHVGGKTQNTFDQNRIYIGFLFETSKKLSIDFGYLNWYQYQSTNTFFNRNIFRLGINHKFSLQP